MGDGVDEGLAEGHQRVLWDVPSAHPGDAAGEACVPSDETRYLVKRGQWRALLGDLHWAGEVYQGVHTPLISRELWDKVQRGFDERYQNQLETQRRDLFAYTGLMVCGHCGCIMTAEIKKEKYVNYHCTGFKGDCGEPYVREEVIIEAFGQALMVIALPGPAMMWLVSALRKSHGDQQQYHAESIKRLEEECSHLQRRLDAMYLDFRHIRRRLKQTEMLLEMHFLQEAVARTTRDAFLKDEVLNTSKGNTRDRGGRMLIELFGWMRRGGRTRR